MRRISWFIGLVIGVLLIAAAPVVRWGVAPAVTKLPGNTDTIRTYTGTAATVINPSLLTGTLFGPALLHNQPVTVIHHVKVLMSTAGVRQTASKHSSFPARRNISRSGSPKRASMRHSASRPLRRTAASSSSAE